MHQSFMLIRVAYNLQLPAVRAQTKTSYSLAYLTSWHNNIFVHTLRTVKAENP